MGGRLEIVTGPMFAGKTEHLISRLRHEGSKVQAYKPKIDGRYSSSAIVSHAGDQFDATPVDVNELALATAEVIGIDEIQFFGDRIVSVVQSLLKAGSDIVASGLDLNCWGEPFGPMPTLLCLADDVVKLQAICASCGSGATRTQRRVRSNAEILVGGAESYEPRCLGCFDP